MELNSVPKAKLKEVTRRSESQLLSKSREELPMERVKAASERGPGKRIARDGRKRLEPPIDRSSGCSIAQLQDRS